ncbi:chaperone modulator CbpM [Salinisphaera sp. SPP-AMP-43]|uniref:chaperone modulator CbpM n=1 Tax=Salinisphaera sp. SPP-AMP-43 TaxID=3121288 RepID=UPI003C6DEB6C
MQDKSYTAIRCEIVEHSETMTLGQICRSCGVHAEWVTLLVEEGILEPIAPQERQWRFAAAHLPRVHTARRLAQDLGLNTSGIALALELMDEIRELRGRLEAQELTGPSR